MKQKLSLLFLFITFIVFGSKGQAKETLTIKHIELGYPCPAIPFYHFSAELEYGPSPSISMRCRTLLGMAAASKVATPPPIE